MFKPTKGSPFPTQSRIFLEKNKTDSGRKLTPEYSTVAVRGTEEAN
jgi:hypothetical protein